MNLGERGFLAIPMALLLSVLAGCALMLLGLMSRWDHHVRIQLRLDRCVRQIAIELRETQNRIEGLNTQIRIARASAVFAAAAGQGELLATLQKTTSVLALLQEGVLLKWGVRQASALVDRTCPLDPIHAADFMTPLPWSRPPADPLGQPPLEWRDASLESADPTGTGLRVYLSKKGIKSHAAITRSRNRIWKASFELHFETQATEFQNNWAGAH